MARIQIEKYIESDVLHVPELREFLGKRVAVTIEPCGEPAIKYSRPRTPVVAGGPHMLGSTRLDEEIAQRFRSNRMM